MSTSSTAIRTPAIDIVVNPMTADVIKCRPDYRWSFFASRFKVPDQVLSGITIERHLELMDAGRVQLAFLAAVKCGHPCTHPANWHLPASVVEAIVRSAPDRFRGLLGVDPHRGVAQLEELEWAAATEGFVGAHLYPHWFETSPDDRLYYPIYEKCQELGLPIQMQVGHCLVYSKDRPLPSVGRPIALDRLAIDFPNLTIVGIHTGWPWSEEMISVAWKHENVYIGIDAYAPRHLPQSLVRFMNGWGRGKVMFGTDWPVIEFERAAREVEHLGLSEAALRAVKWETAARVYGLDVDPARFADATADADQAGGDDATD